MLASSPSNSAVSPGSYRNYFLDQSRAGPVFFLRRSSSALESLLFLLPFETAGIDIFLRGRERYEGVSVGATTL